MIRHTSTIPGPRPHHIEEAVSDEPDEPIVPQDFDVPLGLDHPSFRLRPLGPEHNTSDHGAWMSSIEHIRTTPGFVDHDWPQPMSAEENLADLETHARHFEERVGFTYTVLAPGSDEVLGCVYIYGDTEGGTDAQVRSWVRADHAELDRVLHDTVRAWLDEFWPFDSYRYDLRS